jgi:hypothetical protein
VIERILMTTNVGGINGPTVGELRSEPTDVALTVISYDSVNQLQNAVSSF